MKDFLGNVLEIGDEVMLVAPKYCMFARAKVISFTPKKVRVRFNYTCYVQEYDSESKFLVKTTPKYPHIVEESIYKYGENVYVWFDEAGMIGGASNFLDEARDHMLKYAAKL